MPHTYNKKLYYKNSNIFRCLAVHYISDTQMLPPGRNCVSPNFSKFPRDPVPLKVCGLWHGTATVKGMRAWLLDLLVMFSTGLGHLCLVFFLFTSRVGRPTGEGVLLPGILPRTGTDFEVCRQTKFWFGGLHLKFSLVILRHNQRLPPVSIFGVSGLLIFILFMVVH